LSAQVTRVFSKSLEIYLGGENLTNFMVHNPIFSAENPQDKAFDSSLIWGPVFGRMVYVGLRWNLL
jgi:outer membrane receptor for ferrienterochelin and colicins